MNEHADIEPRGSLLDAFARAAERPLAESSGALTTVGAASPVERIVGAQQVAVRRDETKILEKIKVLASAAGSDWYYRFPVKTKGGGQDWIEGQSIKLANDLARVYGNCEIDTRVTDLGDSWLIYARFTDYETGFTMTRPFQQRKGQRGMRGEGDRMLDINLQIGASKAIRNVIVNSLQSIADFALEEARNALVEKVGKNLESYRKRAIERLKEMQIEVQRVEHVLGRPASKWMAPDVAKVIAMIQSINDGMTTVDDAFPPIAEVTPQATAAPAATASSPPHEGEVDAQAAGVADSPSQEERSARGPDVQQPQERSPDPGDVYIATAEERGRDARRQGLKPKDMPPEYTEPKRGKEAIAWRRGYNGE